MPDALDLQQLAYRPAWWDQAACRGMGLSTFFSPGGTGRALATCSRCPVRAQCLAEALAIEQHTRYSDGVVGGLTARERRQLRQGLTCRAG